MPDDAGWRQTELREQVSAEEWQARVDLAALYRLLAHYGWDDLVETHTSVAVPGSDNRHFLINPLGLTFDQVTASNLVKIDCDGEPVMPSPYGVNSAGFIIHSAVHMARPDAFCVMHTHTVEGIAVAMQAHGLLSASQNACLFHGNTGYYSVDNRPSGIEARAALARDLGSNCVLIMRNHGLLVCGRTAGETIWLMHSLQKACAAQVAALAGGVPLTPITEETAAWYGRMVREEDFALKRGAVSWPGLLQKLDRIDPSYRT